MKNKSLRTILPVVLGIILITAAAVLLINKNSIEPAPVVDIRADVSAIEDVLPPKTAGAITPRYYYGMPMMSVDGRDYIGLLELEDYNIKLPVFARWDEQTAKSAPCKYFGNVYDGSLVIGGANTDASFSFLTKLDKDDNVSFTDLTGKVFSYKVSAIKHLQNTDFASNGCELVLFSYLQSDSKYISVECIIQ